MLLVWIGSCGDKQEASKARLFDCRCEKVCEKVCKNRFLQTFLQTFQFCKTLTDKCQQFFFRINAVFCSHTFAKTHPLSQKVLNKKRTVALHWSVTLIGFLAFLFSANFAILTPVDIQGGSTREQRECAWPAPFPQGANTKNTRSSAICYLLFRGKKKGCSGLTTASWQLVFILLESLQMGAVVEGPPAAQ